MIIWAPYISHTCISGVTQLIFRFTIPVFQPCQCWGTVDAEIASSPLLRTQRALWSSYQRSHLLGQKTALCALPADVNYVFLNFPFPGSFSFIFSQPSPCKQLEEWCVPCMVNWTSTCGLMNFVWPWLDDLHGWWILFYPDDFQGQDWPTATAIGK